MPASTETETKHPALQEETSDESGGSMISTLFGILLLTIFVVLGLQARGFNLGLDNVVSLVQPVVSRVRDFASNLNMNSEQARDYSMSFVEAGQTDATTSEVQQAVSHRGNDSFDSNAPSFAGPSLA